MSWSGVFFTGMRGGVSGGAFCFMGLRAVYRFCGGGPVAAGAPRVRDAGAGAVRAPCRQYLGNVWVSARCCDGLNVSVGAGLGSCFASFLTIGGELVAFRFHSCDFMFRRFFWARQ